MKKTGLFLLAMTAVVAFLVASCGEPAWKKTIETISTKMEALEKAADKVAAGDEQAIADAKPMIKEINDLIAPLAKEDEAAKKALDEVRKKYPNTDTLLSAQSLDDFKIIKDAKDILVKIDPQIQEFLAAYAAYDAAPTDRALGLKVKQLSEPLMVKYNEFEAQKAKLSPQSLDKYQTLKDDLFKKYPKLNEAMLKLKK